MGALTAGEVVLVPLPFSDLSKSKLRPALVLADAQRDDWVLCQITGNPFSDPDAITLVDDSFTNGSLQKTSYARPGKLFTANRRLVVTSVGMLKKEPLAKIIDAIITILRSGLRENNEHV